MEREDKVPWHYNGQETYLKTAPRGNEVKRQLPYAKSVPINVQQQPTEHGQKTKTLQSSIPPSPVKRMRSLVNRKPQPEEKNTNFHQ